MFCDEIKKRYQLFPYAFHITHIDNLPGILQNKCLFSKALLENKHIKYQDISDPGVQDKRSQIIVPETKRSLHEYVPFYFTYKTPMIAKRQNENENLVYLQISLDVLQKPNVVITDGNATAQKTVFRHFTNLNDLEILDLSVLQKTITYAADQEKKRKKSAEILIPDKLEWSNILRLICFSNPSKERVLSILGQFDMKIEVWVKKSWFYYNTGN